MIKMEMHVHTRYSNDSVMCLWILYIMCRFFKIDCIAITDHNNILGAVAFREFCEKRKNRVKVIIGEEIYTKQGEIIGLFLNEEIEAGLEAAEAISRIRKQGGIVYVPHPYDLKRSNTVLDEDVICSNKEKIDCIEVHNGRNISKSYDIKQLEIAEKYRIRQIIGSDAHTMIEIGRNYVEVGSIPNSASEFAEVLKEAKFKCSNCIKASHHITKVVKVLKMIGRGNFCGVYIIITRRVKRYKY